MWFVSLKGKIMFSPTCGVFCLKKDYSFPNRLTNIERSSCQNRIAQDSATIWNVGWFGRETLFCRCCQVIRTIHGLHFLISRSFENPKRTRSAQFLPEAFRNAVMQSCRQLVKFSTQVPIQPETISNHIRGLLWRRVMRSTRRVPPIDTKTCIDKKKPRIKSAVSSSQFREPILDLFKWSFDRN